MVVVQRVGDGRGDVAGDATHQVTTAGIPQTWAVMEGKRHGECIVPASSVTHLPSTHELESSLVDVHVAGIVRTLPPTTTGIHSSAEKGRIPANHHIYVCRLLVIEELVNTHLDIDAVRVHADGRTCRPPTSIHDLR